MLRSCVGRGDSGGYQASTIVVVVGNPDQPGTCREWQTNKTVCIRLRGPLTGDFPFRSRLECDAMRGRDPVCEPLHFAAMMKLDIAEWKRQRR